MLELTLSPANTNAKADIKVPVSKLLCVIHQQNAPDGFSGLQSVLLANSANSIPANATLEVIKYDQKGAVTLVNPMPLRALAEIAANNEGCIVTKALGGGVLQTTFTVELSNLGAIKASNNEFVQVIARGFDQVDTECKIYSMGAPVATDVHLVYKPIACQANGENRVDVANAYAIAVPVSLTRLELRYPNGEVVRVLGEELEPLACDTGDTVYQVLGASYPMKDWRVIPCELASTANITLSVSETCYMLINELN